MFIERGHFAKTQFLLEKGLDVAVLRRRVIADNIANVDVPHFKRSEVSYEAQLRRALDHEEYVKRNEVPAKLTDIRHIPFFRAMDYREVKPRTHIDYLTTMRNDGNNVDPEHELTEALKNQLAYQAITNALNNNFRALNIVMRLA
ncbi:MAG: flagellar basal body rod protein FlgB [Leptospiraceae bacterium]|nr:flagellar basal body rod protein FlgB [Leptospiraceae bacterium]MDW8305967.1 flagellar basal body rod protein FlgB [Leptospiraceae bacterium]